jgi:hypothetical protein
MDFYEFMESCKEDGLTPDTAIDEWYRYQAERHAMFMEAYESDTAVNYGWAQQDTIDMYRSER